MKNVMVLAAVCAALCAAARAETVLVSYQSTTVANRQVKQFTVTNGVWTFEKTFASGTYDGKGFFPAGLASDGRRVYVADDNGFRILAFEKDGTFAGTVANFATTCTPEALWASMDGSLYMSAAFGTVSDKIFRFALDTWQGGEFIASNGWNGADYFENPRGIATDENGILYVADRQRNLIRAFDAQTGAYLTNHLTVAVLTGGLTYDFRSRRLLGSGRLLNESVTQIFQVTNGVATSLVTGGTAGANALGILAIGEDVYYSSYSENKIYRVRPDGTRTVAVDAQADANQPMYMMIVPEHSTVLTNGLAARWRFDEPANAAVLPSDGPVGWCGIEARGYLQSGAAGVEDGALWFNDTSYGQLSNSKALIPATNDFSVFLWAGASASGTGQRHLFTCNAGQAGRCELGYDFTAGSAKKLFWWHVDGLALVSTNDARDGAWHHVGVIRRGDTFELWLDGAKETNAAAAVSVSQTVEWRIGASLKSPPEFLLRTGAFMDELRVYRRALDPAEVGELFAAHAPGAAPSRPALPVPDFTAATGLGAVAVGWQPRIAEPADAPCLLRRTDRTLLASYDVCGEASALTRVCRSQDGGATWAQLAEVGGLARASLFEHGGTLCLLGISALPRGNVRLHTSADGGATWSGGVSVWTASAASMAPGPVAVRGGRVWKPFADMTGTLWPRDARARVLSAPEGADLTVAANWTATQPCWSVGDGWHGKQYLYGWNDGNLVETKEGDLIDVLSVPQNKGGRAEVAALARVVDSASSVTNNADTDFAMLPGAAKPFMVRYDASSGLYWTVTSATAPSENVLGAVPPENVVHRLAVYSSHNLRDWCLRTVLLDASEGSADGFQRASFAFDGDDFIVLFAAAYADGQHGARSATEPNLVLFKRVPGFRGLPVDEGEARMLVADTGNNRVVRYSLNSLGQWQDDNVFAAGMVKPFGLARLGDKVYVSEQTAGGRILAYTLKGWGARMVTAFAGDATLGALAAAPDGTLVVAVGSAADGDKVYRVNPATGAKSVFIDTTGWGGTLFEVRGVACDGVGNVFVAARSVGSASTLGQFFRFSPAGTLLDSTQTHDQPRGVYYDASVPRLIGTVYGACDVLALPIPLGSGVPKIGDYSVATKFYGVGMVDGRVCFTDYDYGMVHITRSAVTAQGSVAAGLKNPAGLLLIPEGAVMEPGTQLGTLVLVK
jgi:sugar lactone lactonase YvrE